MPRMAVGGAMSRENKDDMVISKGNWVLNTILKYNI